MCNSSEGILTYSSSTCYSCARASPRICGVGLYKRQIIPRRKLAILGVFRNFQQIKDGVGYAICPFVRHGQSQLSSFIHHLDKSATHGPTISTMILLRRTTHMIDYDSQALEVARFLGGSTCWYHGDGPIHHDMTQRPLYYQLVASSSPTTNAWHDLR